MKKIFFSLKFSFIPLFTFVAICFLSIQSAHAEEFAETISAKGKVLEIIKTEEVQNPQYGESSFTMFDTEVSQYYTEETLKIRIIRGEEKGREVILKNVLENTVFDVDAKVNDVLFLYGNTNEETGEIEYYIQGFWHLDTLIVLLILLCIFVFFYGKKQGIKSLLSLFISLGIIFFLYIPAIQDGKNPLLWAIITSFLISVFTLPIIHDVSKKAVISIIATVVGIVVATFFLEIVDSFGHFSGLGSADIRLFITHSESKNVDTSGILFSAIIIGALGAIMDVAVSISSGLQELKEHKKDISQKEMFISGMNIGKDILGSMLNTIVFAYVGASIGIILLVSQSGTPLFEFLNYSSISEEILRAIIGSFALTATIPVTAFIASKIHTYK